MLVNEGKIQFEVFLATHSEKFSDNEYHGPVDLSNQIHDDDSAPTSKHKCSPHTIYDDKRKTASKGTEINQQSTKVPSTSPFQPTFSEGTTVRLTVKGKKRKFIIGKILLAASGLQRYKLRSLNGTTSYTVANK